MSNPGDDKIELLVRSVLAAVDARLIEVRSEIRAVTIDVEGRYQAMLAQLQEMEHRWASTSIEGGHAATGADPLAARMEQATQVLLERIEAMHQRSTIATNERFALINQSLEQLHGSAVMPAAPAMPSLDALDALNAPLRVGSPTGQVPAVSQTAATISLPPIPQLTTAPGTTAPGTTTADVEGESEPIDLGRLADLLSEQLGQFRLPPQQT